jgi:hypothetical protein
LVKTVTQYGQVVEDSEELMKDLNLTNDLAKFVRINRQRIQAALVNGTQYLFIYFCVGASIDFISMSRQYNKQSAFPASTFTC